MLASSPALLWIATDIHAFVAFVGATDAHSLYASFVTWGLCPLLFLRPVKSRERTVMRGEKAGGRWPDESLATRGSRIWSHLDRSSLLSYRPMNENQLPPHTLGEAGLNLLLCWNKQTTESMATFFRSFLKEGTRKKRIVWEICCLDRSLLLTIPLEIRFEIFMFIIHFKQQKK